MFTLLALGSGIFWSITYILIIWRGFQDKTCGMLVGALCLNISWEFIFSFILPHRPIQRIIDISWFLLDTVILAQFLKYGFDQFPYLSKLSFYMVFAVTLITSFCTVLFASIEFHDLQGVYAAFGQNLLMSILLITMLY
jgi:ABC-type multidrug transport system permease subunit